MFGGATHSVTDFDGFSAMRARARTGEDQAANLDEVAHQFESLFINMLLKQMRQANEGLSDGGLMDSQQSRFYRDMYDQQISLHMAGQGGVGLAPAIRRQLGGEAQIPQGGLTPADYQAIAVQPRPVIDSPAQVDRMAAQPIPQTVVQEAAAPSDHGPMISDQASFIRQLRPHAEAAARRLGVPAEALIAQAALESGWGRHVMQDGEGRSSHNLFGIKADRRWSGERVSVNTLEYRDGVAMKTRADFRAYGSFADSFADYADFIGSNRRYRPALEAGMDSEGYLRGLQQAGYATDPAYADKIVAILRRPEFAAEAEPLRVAQR